MLDLYEKNYIKDVKHCNESFPSSERALNMKKVNEGIDRYDDMDGPIDMANKEMENLLKLLKREKIQVNSFKEADYDVDAYIKLKNGVNIQITLDGTYEVSKFDGRVIKHIKSFPNLNRLIQFLKSNI